MRYLILGLFALILGASQATAADVKLPTITFYKCPTSGNTMLYSFTFVEDGEKMTATIKDSASVPIKLNGQKATAAQLEAVLYAGGDLVWDDSDDDALAFKSVGKPVARPQFPPQQSCPNGQCPQQRR